MTCPPGQPDPGAVPRAATIEDDAALLGAWAQAFGAFCNRPVVVDPLGGTGGASEGWRLTFPPVFEPPELIGGTGHFRHHPLMVEHVRRMGFAWNADGRILTVPAPGTFNAQLARFGTPHAGFQLAYAGGTAARMPLGPWLRRYLDGLITVLVNAPSFYHALPGRVLDPRARGDVRWGLMSLAHDVSIHALNYHLIPHVAVADLARRIRRTIPERYDSWEKPDSMAPLTLTYFYDNDLNRYAYAVWCRSACPADFGSIFLAPRNYGQLVAALEVRLKETQAGQGDVASGDFDDMGPLAPTSFEVV